MQPHKAICPAFLFWFSFFIATHFLVSSQGYGLNVKASPTSLDDCLLSTPEPSKDCFYIHRLKHHEIDPFIDKLKRIVNDPVIPSQFKNDLESAIDFCVPDLGSRSIIFCAHPPILDTLKKLAQAVDIPAKEEILEILIVKTAIANSSAFIVNEVSLDRLNSLDISVGKSITYQGVCCHSMPELRRHISNDPQIEIISSIQSSQKDANTLVTKKNLYTSEKDVLACLHENTHLNDVQVFEVGLTVHIKTQMCDDLGVDLNIFSESITPNPHTKVCLDNHSNVDMTSSLFAVNRVTKDVNLPNGCFAVIPLLIEDSEEQEIEQVPCLDGVAFCDGRYSHRRISEQKSLFLIVKLPPLVIGEQFQLADIFD